jgi:hypothetical protein
MHEDRAIWPRDEFEIIFSAVDRDLRLCGCSILTQGQKTSSLSKTLVDDTKRRQAPQSMESLLLLAIRTKELLTQ